MTETDYNTMPLDELEKMVAGIPTSQMDTENPAPEEKSDTEVKDKSEQMQESAGSESTEEPKEEDKQETTEPEKKTPESIKKLLHQRSELRQDNDRLKTELEEAKEQLRKLRS